MGDKIQQIIQHRKGCIDKVKDINSYISEIIYGIGDVGDLKGNVVFIGNQNSGSGNYSPISKIYFGTNAPTINGYGKTLNGIPFYSVYDKTLYILNNPKNIDMDLSGNIYRRNIAPNNISASGFISGNSLNITGDVTLGKNDANIIELNGKIKGSLIPLVSNTYDLGTPTNKWRNIYATNISGAFSGDGSNLKNVNTSMSVELIGSSTNSYNLSIPSEKLTFYTDVSKGLNLIMGSKRVEITPYDASYTQKGVSYYNPSDFIVSAGYISSDYTKLNNLSESFKNFTSSIQNWTSSFESYTSSIGNYTKTINTSLNQLLVGSSSYSNTLNVNVLSNSSINFKLADDLKISSSISTNNLFVTSSTYIGGYLQLMGNLYVSGTVTVIDSINVNIGDNIIGLNAAGNLADGGIYVYDYVGGLTTGSLLWDVTNNWWKAGEVGNEKRIVFQENNTNLTPNSLTFANSNGRLISAIAPSTNDIPLWNGTTWTNINSLKFATTSSLGDFTASFNTWTGSIFLPFSSSVNNQFNTTNTILNNFSVYTSSMNTWTGSFSSSINTQFLNVSNSLNSLNLYTSSNNTILNNFSVYTSSFQITYNNFSSSVNTQFLNVNSTLNNFSVYTSSMNTWTGSVNTILNNFSVYTSSFQNTYINFSSSVNTQFLNVNSTLNSLNSYTSSNNTILNNFSVYTSSMNVWTGSVNTILNNFSVYTSSMNTWTGSVNTILNNFSVYTSSLNIATGSYFKQGGNSFGQSGSLGTNDNYPLVFKTNNINRIVLGTDGKFTIGTVSTLNGILNVGGDIIATGGISAYNPSDIRLKKNILKIKNASKLLSQINGYTFDWNDKQTMYEDGTHDVGVIAQEIEKIFPQIIGQREGGYKSVKYDRLIPLLIEGFNELRKEFEYLKTKI